MSTGNILLKVDLLYNSDAYFLTFGVEILIRCEHVLRKVLQYRLLNGTFFCIHVWFLDLAVNNPTESQNLKESCNKQGTPPKKRKKKKKKKRKEKYNDDRKRLWPEFSKVYYLQIN